MPTAFGAMVSTQNMLRPTVPQPTISQLSGTMVITRPADFILTQDAKCGYTNARGKACRKDMRDKKAGDVARHWFTCHAMREAQDIRRKLLVLKTASIVNTEARMNGAAMYLVRCPLLNCKDRNDPDALLVQPDQLLHRDNSAGCWRISGYPGVAAVVTKCCRAVGGCSMRPVEAN
jgi:hypothetical protein